MRILNLLPVLLFVLGSSLQLPAAVLVGAEVPWTTYQAEEAATTTGEKLSSRVYGEIANEAINHACVRLAAANQHITWKVTKPANAFVVRVCMPDTAEGAGADYTLTLAVNGAARQKVSVSSRHSWLYGSEPNGNENKPGTGAPHAFFDEVRGFISGAALKAGDTFTIYKQATDTAPWYVVDLVDLELVQPPANMPEGFLSVADFGAKPDDGADDTVALKDCVAKAKSEGKTVWFPPGLFHQTESLTLDQVRVLGAGSWHTRLSSLGKHQPNFFVGNVGFRITGKDVQITGIAIDGTLTTRSTEAIQNGVSGGCDRLLLEDLWVSHTTTGVWIGPCTNAVVRRCRFRDTYADGLNINNHSEDVLVEHNHSRGNGDDGFAVFSGSNKGGAAGPCRRVQLRNNTAEGQRWGNGLGIYGGEDISALGNLVRSANRASGLSISTNFESWPLKEAVVSGNAFVDCGGTAFNQKHPAISIYVPGADLQGLRVERNTILAASFDGIKIVSQRDAGMMEATLQGNKIETLDGVGIMIQADVRGQLVVKDNQASVKKPHAKWVNQSKPDWLRLTTDMK